ncbi:MAG: hypothetical protein J6M10_03650 [Clostridia bacterium]|nr:hypothetical protein [Clostridia bacterium]
MANKKDEKEKLKGLQKKGGSSGTTPTLVKVSDPKTSTKPAASAPKPTTTKKNVSGASKKTTTAPAGVKAIKTPAATSKASPAFASASAAKRTQQGKNRKTLSAESIVNDRSKYLLGLDMNKATPLEIAESINLYRKAQAVGDSMSRTTGNLQVGLPSVSIGPNGPVVNRNLVNPGEGLYGMNDAINQNINGLMNKFKEKASEDDMRQALELWKSDLDSISDADEVGSRYNSYLKQGIADLEDYARNTYSSFSDEEINDIGGQIAANNVRLKQLGAYGGRSNEDATIAQNALDAIATGNDPIMMVENNAQLREMVGYDKLANLYGNEMGLSDAIRRNLANLAQGAGTAEANRDEIIRLTEENMLLNGQMDKAAARRDKLREAESYQALLDQGIAKTALPKFSENLEHYEPVTEHKWVNPDTGEEGITPEFNRPTLDQIVAAPRKIRNIYEASDAYTQIGSIPEIDLAYFMTKEERENYKAISAYKGSEAAQEYFDLVLRSKLEMRQTQAEVEHHQELIEQGGMNAIGANALSFAYNQLSNLGEAADTIKTIFGGEPMEQNQFKAITNEGVRNPTIQAVTDATPGLNFNLLGQQYNLAGMGLQAMYAAGDELTNRLTFGAYSPAAMAAQAGFGSFNEAYADTGDIERALLAAGPTAAAEYLTEKMGFDWLGKTKNIDTLGGLARYVGGNAVGEGLEEVFSGAGSAAGETLLGELTGLGSTLGDRFRYLTENGYDAPGALGVLAQEFGAQAVNDFAVGTLAGFGMSASNAAVTAPAQAAYNQQVGRQIEVQGNVASILEMGLKSPDKGVQKVSQNLMDKLNLTDPEKPVLPDDAQTKAEVQLVTEAVQEQQAADSAKQQKNNQQRTEDTMREPAQAEPKAQMRTEVSGEQKAADTAKQQANNQKKTESAMRELSKREARQVGRLYNNMLSAMDVQVGKDKKALEKAVKKRIAELGSVEVDEVVEAIAAVAMGEEVTQDQLDLAEAAAMKDGPIKEIADSLTGYANSMSRMIQAGFKKLDSEGDEAAPGEQRAEDAMPKTVKSVDKAAVTYTTEEGETISGAVEGFAADDSGKVLPVVNGSTVAVNDLDISDAGSDMLIRRGVDLGSAEAASAMYDSYEEGQNVAAYATGFEAAFHYGEIGMEKAKAQGMQLVNALTNSQFDAAYVAGASAAAARPRTKASVSGGKVTFADGLDKRMDGLDDNQRSAISVLTRLAQTGAMNIEIFESQADASGSYMHSDQGWYDKSTNTLHFDVKAGKNRVTDAASYAILRVGGHELTHYIKEQNTEAYNSLQSFVVEQLTKDNDLTFDALVASKIENARKRGRELSYETAVEEVVADGCEMMLKNSTAIQQLAQRDMGLFKRVRSWIRKFAQRVQRAFRGVSANSMEARLIQDVQGLQKLWDDALVGAMENVRRVQETADADVEESASEAGEKFSSRDGVEFLEDKYYARLIDDIRNANPDGYIHVGRIIKGSVLNQVGMLDAELYFDVKKIQNQLDAHDDHVDEDVLKWIPQILRDPIAIAEANAKDTVNVFSEKQVGDSPVMVAVMIAKNRSGKNVINKVRTIHARRDYMSRLADERILYLNPNKKRTQDWFQARGNVVPLGGTKFGFIRSIAQPAPSVKFSPRTDTPSDRDLLRRATAEDGRNSTEQEFISEYIKRTDELIARQEELEGIRSEIRRMQNMPRRDVQQDKEYLAKLNRLKTRADVIARQIERDDQKLRTYERSAPLKKVLAREREWLVQHQRARTEEIIDKRNERRADAETRRKIIGLLDRWDKQLKNPTKTKYIPRDTALMVIAARELVNTENPRANDAAKAKAREKIASMKSVYERYKNDATFAYVYDEAIKEMMDSIERDVGEKSIYQLSSAELRGIYDMLRAVQKQVSEAAYSKTRADNVTIMDWGRRMFEETRDAEIYLKGRAGDYVNWQLTPDKFFARLAGYKKDSEWSRVARAFSDGTERMLEIQRDAYYHFRKWTESKQFDKLSDTSEKALIDIGLRDADGNAVKITRGMMLEVYMHLLAEDNRRGFLYGGFSVPKLKKYYANKVAESYGTGSTNTFGAAAKLAEINERMYTEELSDEEFRKLKDERDRLEQQGMANLDNMLAEIEGRLTDWDRSFIQAVREWNDGKSRDYINDVTMDLYGLKRAGVENYYPIRRDTAFVNTDFDSISRNMNLENWGSLKERVPSQAPILLGDIAFTLDTSIKQMSRYVAYARAQRDFNKLYNVRMPGMTGSVKKIVGTKFGTGKRGFGASGEQYIENYLGSITGSRQAESDFLSVIRRNLPRATMSLNFRVGFSQISALPKAAVEVGWKNLAQGMAQGGTKALFSKKAREELARKNAWFWQRYQGEGGQREFADAKGGRGSIDKAWNWIDDHTGGWLLNLNQKVDVATTAAMWSSAEAWVRNNKRTLQPGSEAFEEAVNEKYTDILRNTQAANTVSERSDLARGTGFVNSILTMYKSEAFANFNIMYDAAARLKKYKNDLKAGRNGVTKADVSRAGWQLANSITSVVIASSVLNAGIKVLINAIFSNMSGYRDDEDEITMESIAASIGKEMLSDAAGMAALGGQLYDFVSAAIFKEQYYAPSYAALDEITAIAESSINLVNDDNRTGEDYAKWAKKMGYGVANMLGIPAKNAVRQVEGLVNTVKDIGNGQFLRFEASADRSNGTNYSRLLKASLEGDDEKYAEVMDELAKKEVDEEKAQGGYRDELKKAYEDGEVERERALELLEKYGGKSADDAYWLLEKWDYEGEENYSKYTDLRTALAEGNRSDASAAIDELIGHGVKEETLADEISGMYGKGEATTIMALQLRPGRLYTPSKPKESKDDFNDFLDAVLAGGDVKGEIKKLRSKGYSTNNIMTALNRAFGQSANRYAIMKKYNPSEAKVLEERVLDAYVALGLPREDERIWIHENWIMPEEDEEEE